MSKAAGADLKKLLEKRIAGMYQVLGGYPSPQTQFVY